MEEEKVKQLFYEFLVKQGALFNVLQYTTIEKLFKDTKKVWGDDCEDPLFYLIHCVPAHAVLWDDTNEGHEFWNNLDDKWYFYYKYKNEKQHELGKTIS